MKSRILVKFLVAAAVLGFVVAQTGQARAAASSKRPRAAASSKRQLVAATPSAAVPPAVREQMVRKMIPKLGSGLVAQRMAEKRGITSMAGKRLNVPEKRVSTRFRNGVDVDVAGDYYGWAGKQNEPSIAVSPTDPNIVVAFAHNDYSFAGNINDCSIYISEDAGASFYYWDDAPLEVTDRDGDTNLDIHFCSDPVVRASAFDGFDSYFYFSYMDINEGDDFVIETDKVRVNTRLAWYPWSSSYTRTAFDGGASDFVDKEWVDVHTYGNPASNGGSSSYVYATTTNFKADGSCSIYANVSSDWGNTWDYGTGGAQLVSSGGAASCGAPTVVQGSRPVGGGSPNIFSAANVDTNVLICYYDSGTDGWSPGISSSTPSNLFHERCFRSDDNLANVTGPITAAGNIAFEAPYYLGPNFNYHRWWGAVMFPSVAIDHLGNAHIAFGADNSSSKNDAESGTIYYARSIFNATTNPLFGVWTGKLALTGGLAQGFPSVVAQRSIAQVAPIVYVGYLDHQKSVALGVANYNLIYDTFFRKSTTGGASFLAGVRVTDQSSLSDYSFIGDYIDAAVSSQARSKNYHIIWTDRADKISIFDYEDDVFADRF